VLACFYFANSASQYVDIGSDNSPTVAIGERLKNRVDNLTLGECVEPNSTEDNIASLIDYGVLFSLLRHVAKLTVARVSRAHRNGSSLCRVPVA
jgi:hypothetical protein